MKNDWTHLDKFRTYGGAYATAPGERRGMFHFPLPGSRQLRVLATDGEDADADPKDHQWEHVSVSGHCLNGAMFIPTWEMMCQIKDYFWDEEERVIQFHPPRSEYVNTCNFCLHLWSPVGVDFPHPATLLVG